MKIAYATVYDVLNKGTWSKHLQGLCTAGSYIAKNLVDENTNINYIGPLKKSFSVLTRTKWSLYRNVFKKDYYSWAEPLVARNYAYQIETKLNFADCDVVLCPENVIPIAYLKCKQPIVLWTDATLNSLINFYRHLDNLCDETIENIYKLEKKALNRCDLIIFTSEWAANNAIETYAISPSKIKVVPFGANLESNRSYEDIRSCVESKTQSPFKLLFMGVDWVRKGGSTALQIATELNNFGLKTELLVVGCQPPINVRLPDFVKVIDFIDKSKPEGLDKINKLFAEAHFLVLPTLADCTPHVFAEANSFGVPCISTNVGGIATLIQDNLNGRTFSVSASVSEYCDYIISVMTNYGDYQKLALSSFEEYQSRLNWNVAVKNVKELMMELCDTKFIV
ncbi:MAG: glycosyltransferase family 4 protein [Cyanomargarita calcarea GSE-NOS-MK-12-04C]|jgi:glycosyltransferase involved in cell wall biosynthesis|uniref:Glycosyltransferase family 4 protein n=1 Tax=Cyanomargarita calcarea GSE-NOS-MK-12-04C TaxID=2839659 RepID=A0A951UV89_9CYAN|nr:glycosyltransferase family 4 protein [Cyanomargarita calcarea GSE-NOS-MK-12-04C]